MPLNRIFSAIKKYCGRDGTIYTPCHQMLKQQFNLTDQQLEVYLEILANLGVITFKNENKEISLTLPGQAAGTISTTFPGEC
jgi:hypothetical protein